MPEMSLFGVYDGHGGAEVAQWIAKKLPEIIKNEFGKAKISETDRYQGLEFIILVMFYPRLRKNYSFSSYFRKTLLFRRTFLNFADFFFRIFLSFLG